MVLVETFTKKYYQFEFDIQIYMDLNERLDEVYTIGIFISDNTVLYRYNVVNEYGYEYAEMSDLSKEQKDKIISKIVTVLRNYLKTKKTAQRNIRRNSGLSRINFKTFVWMLS